MKFILNQKIIETNEPLGIPTLDFLRKIGIKGVKESCHEGDCGACMVLLGDLKDNTLVYKATTSCLLPLGEIAGKHLVTIEGLNQNGLNPIQQAFVDTGGTQCGFCTPGIIISLTGFFINSNLEKNDILTAIEGNICRCTGYASIIRATQLLSDHISVVKKSNKERIPTLIDADILPAYFSDISEQLKELKKVPKHNKGTYVAGGTDLFVQNKTLVDPVFLSEMDLSGVWSDKTHIYVGAMTDTESIRTSVELNSVLNIEKHLSKVSSLPIRQKATIGGNIVNASPIGDLTIYFLALDAEISLKFEDKNRIIKLKDFFKGYKMLDLKKGEILEWVRIRKEKKLFSFEKVAKRMHGDIASVNSALSLKLDNKIIREPHLSAGGIGPIPMYLEKTSIFLENKEISSDLIKGAAQITDKEISPIDDVRGSALYKRLLLRQLIYAHFIKLFPEFPELEGLL